MLQKFQAMLSGSFFRNVGVLAAGTTLGQALFVLALPILTRLYSPEAFGLLGIYMSLLMVLAVASCGRLELALALPENDNDAVNLLAMAIGFATAVALVLGAIATAVPAEVSGWLGQPAIARYVWLIPIGTWLLATFSALQFWALRKKRYKTVAATQVVRAAGATGTQLSLGFISPSPGGLILGHALHGGIGALGLASSLLRQDRRLLNRISRQEMWRNLVRYRRFPMFSTAESLLNNAATSLPLVLIGAASGATEAGFLLLAQRVTSIPVSLLGGSISRAYLAEAPAELRAGRLSGFTRKIMGTLLTLSALPFLLVAVLSPFVFPLVFGEQWGRAGVMVAWLAPAMFLQFIVSPVSTILHVTENQRLAMLLQLFGFVLIIGSLLGAGHIAGVNSFEVFAVASLLYYAVYLWLVLRLSRPEPASID